jgi:hypothetical protein
MARNDLGYSSIRPAPEILQYKTDAKTRKKLQLEMRKNANASTHRKMTIH